MVNATLSPRRSALYVPGINQRALAKLPTLDPDVVIFDLEDAVADSDKQEARQCLADYIPQHNSATYESVLRINPLHSQWGEEDLNMAMSVGIKRILLPKVTTCDELDAACSYIYAHKQYNKGEHCLWLMIETAQGVINSVALAKHHAVEVLVLGTSDLGRDLRLIENQSSVSSEQSSVVNLRLGLQPSLGLVILAARAAGCDVLDGIHPLPYDDEGLILACHQGRAMGFDGKTLIHPQQLTIVQKHFSPTVEEVLWAQKITQAWQKNTQQGNEPGVLLVDGTLVENLHVQEAQRILAISATINQSAST